MSMRQNLILSKGYRALSSASACLQKLMLTANSFGCQVGQVVSVKVLQICSGLAGLDCVAQVYKLQQ